ncbi:hypothetical protein [Pseudokineococcus sp. 1T1Z-3]|uniref:hypothetical protein n=1 Tax=Pseudokineococcus sp. 1T1Z-3 TaxID=3132745 RepID=UPI00309C0978
MLFDDAHCAYFCRSASELDSLLEGDTSDILGIYDAGGDSFAASYTSGQLELSRTTEGATFRQMILDALGRYGVSNHAYDAPKDTLLLELRRKFFG